MIPPFVFTKAASLAAPLVARFSSPLMKWGALGLAVVALVAVTNWKTYDWMRTACEEAQQAAVAEQATQSMQQLVELNASREAVYAKHAESEKRLTAKLLTLQQQVAHAQAHAKPGEIPPGAVQLFATARQLFDTVPTTPPAAAAAGAADAAPEARIETTRLLLAYVSAYGDAAEQLATLWTDYDSLVQELRSRYILETTLHEHE